MKQCPLVCSAIKIWQF